MAARPDTSNGSSPARPHLVPPPPDSAEALYYEGMAAYQHRNWEQALERFTSLKELQPARPGLDALLDEVRWFLQLQAAAPTVPGASPTFGIPSPVVVPDKSGRSEREAARPGRRRMLGVVTLAGIGIIALLLFAFRDRLPWSQASDREVQEIFNRGQARLAVGDYEGAEAAFTQLLEISPNNPEAQVGLETAQRQKTLAQGYAAAEAAIAEEDWEKAAEELNRLLAIDPSYSDTSARADFVSQQRRLANLYDDGSRLYDLGQWEEAIVQFERIRELDNAYRTEAVGEFLFVCYLNAGEAMIEQAGGDVAIVTRAVEYFSRALAIHPRNRLASDARRLGGLYLDAVRTLATGDRSEAQSRLEVLLAEAPEYGAGAAAKQLYQILLNDAESALQVGDTAAAIQLYGQAQTVPGVDVSAAGRGESMARAFTPSPTPRPTATATVTPPPRPVAVTNQGPLNLRAGPGTTYAIIGQVTAGARLPVTGRSADSEWLHVCIEVAGDACLSATSKQGWLAARFVVVEGDLTAAAVLTPPAPELSVTALPRPTTAPGALSVCITGQVRDVAGGQPLADWTVTLTGPAGLALSTRTASDGAYRFANLSAGNYTVSESLDSSWNAVSPVSTSLTVTPAPACVVVDFWNSRNSSSGAAPTPPR